MKQVLFIGFILLTFLFTTCKKDDKTTSSSSSNQSGNTTTVTDIDGNVYNTVTICNQIWMKENLKVTKYRDGTSIPNVTDNATWAITTSGAYCSYNNNSGNISTYGLLYNGYAYKDAHNIAPQGWRVPTDDDWATLANCLGGYAAAGFKLKETGTTHWQNPNYASNSSGFTALPAGERVVGTGAFLNMGFLTTYWSGTINFSSLNHCTLFSSDSTLNYVVGFGPQWGCSIRCIKE